MRSKVHDTKFGVDRAMLVPVEKITQPGVTITPALCHILRTVRVVLPRCTELDARLFSPGYASARIMTKGYRNRTSDLSYRFMTEHAHQAHGLHGANLSFVPIVVQSFDHRVRNIANPCASIACKTAKMVDNYRLCQIRFPEPATSVYYASRRYAL